MDHTQIDAQQLQWLKTFLGAEGEARPFQLRNGVTIIGVRFFAQHLFEDLSRQDVPYPRLKAAKQDLEDFYQHFTGSNQDAIA